MEINIKTINPLEDGEYKIEAQIIVKNGKLFSTSNLVIMNMEDLQW